MPDNDSNLIKPVENLQNIARLTPAGRREQKKRRQQLNKKSKQKAEQELDESVDQDNFGSESTENKSSPNTNDAGIDYRA